MADAARAEIDDEGDDGHRCHADNDAAAAEDDGDGDDRAADKENSKKPTTEV